MKEGGERERQMELGAWLAWQTKSQVFCGLYRGRGEGSVHHLFMRGSRMRNEENEFYIQIWDCTLLVLNGERLDGNG